MIERWIGDRDRYGEIWIDDRKNHKNFKFQKLHLSLAHINDKLINSRTSHFLEHYIFDRQKVFSRF